MKHSKFALLSLCFLFSTICRQISANVSPDSIGTSNSEDCDASPGSGSIDDATLLKQLKKKGDAAYRNKDYTTAIDSYTQLINKQATDHSNEKYDHHDAEIEQIYYKRAQTYEKLGKYTLAISDLSKVVEVDKESASAFNLRAKSYMALGWCTEATDDYKTVLKIKSSHGDAKKNIPKARKCAKEVEVVDMNLKRHRWQEAERGLDALIDEIGKAPYFLYLRARARIEQEKYYECIADLTALLKIDSNDVEALYLRALAYYYVKEYDAVKLLIREIMRLSPEHEEAKDLNKKLKTYLKSMEEGDSLANSKATAVAAAEKYKEALSVDERHKAHSQEAILKLCKIYASKLRDKGNAQLYCKKEANNMEMCLLYADFVLSDAESEEELEMSVQQYHSCVQIDQSNHQARQGLQSAEIKLKRSKEKDYYKILGIPKSERNDIPAIKRRYRQLAKEMHPDRFAAEDLTEKQKEDIEKKFHDLAEAYEVLGNEELKGKYDRGEEVFQNQGGGGGQRGNPFGFPGGFPFNFANARRGNGHSQQGFSFHF